MSLDCLRLPTAIDAEITKNPDALPQRNDAIRQDRAIASSALQGMFPSNGTMHVVCVMNDHSFSNQGIP